jgi:inner membrane protein
MVAYLAELGSWNWIILGIVLLALEIVAPGVFLLWIGVAALLTGTISLQLAETGFWGWQVQVLVFLVLSVVAVLVGRRFFSGRYVETDQPLLNRREAQLVGRTATLEEDIVDGRGRIRLGDTLWLVTGPDLPAGTRVRVASAANGELTVEAA